MEPSRSANRVDAPAPSASLREEWKSHAFAALSAGGYKAGGARVAVIELLGAEGGCVVAEGLADRLRQLGRRVGTASVYRALGLLAELGLLHRVALPGAPDRFELVLPDGEHHHHLVCERCGRTDAFSDPALERAIEQASTRARFNVQAHDITLHGTCERCDQNRIA